jgi:hypothetical protein
MTDRPTFPGLHVFHDIRNEKYLLADYREDPIQARPRAVAFSQPVEPVPRSVKHRQYRRYDQGAEPRCTEDGMRTLLAAAHIFSHADHVPRGEWYRMNQAFDRAAGRRYPEGATATAALEVARRPRADGGLELISAYRWTYTVDGMIRAIPRAPLMAATLWYPDMMERDREGIVKTPPTWRRTNDGHLYTLGAYRTTRRPAYDPARDLWDVQQTWKPTAAEARTMPYSGWVWRIPGDLMHRLLREDGEVAQVEEIRRDA